MDDENKILPPDLFGPLPTPTPKKTKPQRKTSAKKTVKKQAISTAKTVKKKAIKTGKKTKKTRTASPSIKTRKPKTEKKKITVKKKSAAKPENKGKKSAPVKRETRRAGDFPWEGTGAEAERIPCPACEEPVYPDSTACIHCGAQFMECPHCRRHTAALYNPKMATEQRLNKILKQYTLFSLALPSLPMQPILDCSSCRSRVILCEQCRAPMRVGAEKCPSCGFFVRRTKLLINPFSIFDSIFRKPNMGKAFAKAIEDIMRTLSEW